MHKSKSIVYFFMAILLVSFASSATIYGNTYDLSLRKINDIRVEINTTPRQFMIAQNGSYSFSVSDGSYTILARLMQKKTLISSVEENITVRQEGSYVLDLILFPYIEKGIEDIDVNLNSTFIDTKDNISYNLLVAGLIVALIAILSVYMVFRTKKKNINEELSSKIKDFENDTNTEDNSLERLISILKREGGRATQKDIRKQIPLSEAKISLMITELEHKGIIEKIKRGRGNIIVLNRKQKPYK